MLVLDNTFYSNNTNNRNYHGAVHMAAGLELRDCVIANNMIYITNAANYAISVFDLNEEPHNSTQIFTNRYYKPSSSIMFFTNVSTSDDEKTFSEWRTYLANVNVTEGDDDSTTGNPNFGNATTSVPGANFYPAANITGTYFGEAAYDIDGRVRANPPTIGAYEWESSGSPDSAVSTGFKSSISNPNSAGWDPDAAGTESPILNIGASPTSGAPPLDVTFTASASDPDGGSITSYTWDFKDGSPTSSTQNPNHIFTSAGTYVVSCTVFDDEAESRTKTISISVGSSSSSDSGSSSGCGPISGFSLLIVGMIFVLRRRK